MGLELALFGLLALIAVVSAAAMIFQENAVHSALFLILNFGCVALLFLMLDAPFIAMVQIAVYAGAIMVLFLFVIMLLGAEQTSDTGTETLKWLPAAATILGVSLLVSLATPLLISGGLALPDAPGEDPQVRLVHAANAADPVTITIGENEPIDGVRFGDTTNFFGLDAGDYPVTIADADGEVIFDNVVALEADQVVTVVAYGQDEVSLAFVPNVLAVNDEDVATFNVLNIAVDAPVSLVDLGSDRELDVADGEITDAVLATDIGYAELAAAFTLPDRRYNLRFVQEINGDFEIIGLSGQMLDVEEGTERTLILTPDFESTANAEGNYRSQVFDSELNIQDPFGSPGDIGGLLFIDYLLPVNLVGFLLLVALVGVIVLTRPEGIQSKRRSTVNRRRKVSRPLVSVISQQTGSDVVVDTPKLDAPEPSDDDA
ncbi:MAG: NADH-quinone oxidoreductase subunit J [Chloroflexota bacterium]